MTKEEFISKLTDKPCQDALDEFDEFSKNYDVSESFEKVLTDFFLNHPKGINYYWWCWEYGLPEEFKTDELFKSSALKRPWTALIHSSNLLSDELFKECALKAPWYALECCSDRLDDETFKEIALKYAWVALKNHSQRCDRLGEEFKEKLEENLEKEFKMFKLINV